MQSRSVQSVAYALAKTPLLVHRACAFLACKSRVCAFAPGFSESCSDSLMLFPVVFFFFLCVLMQLTMCRSGFSLSLSLPLALLYGLICGSCTCCRTCSFVTGIHCDSFRRGRDRVFFFLSFKNWLLKLRADFGLSVAGSIFFVKSVVTGAKTVTNVV